MSDALWDANDVATFLKVSRSWVYNRCDTGELPHCRIGGLVRFDPEKIRAFALGEPQKPAPLTSIRGGQ